MKKNIMFLIFISVFSIISAQKSFIKGDILLTEGFGWSNRGISFNCGLDYALTNVISVGGEFIYGLYKESSINNYKHTTKAIIVKGSYHFNEVLDLHEKWDLYVGLGLGYYIFSSNSTFSGDNISIPGLSGHIGCRFLYSDLLRFTLEFSGGDDIKNGKIGIAIKIGDYVKKRTPMPKFK